MKILISANFAFGRKKIIDKKLILLTIDCDIFPSVVSFSRRPADDGDWKMTERENWKNVEELSGAFHHDETFSPCFPRGQIEAFLAKSFSLVYFSFLWRIKPREIKQKNLCFKEYQKEPQVNPVKVKKSAVETNAKSRDDEFSIATMEEKKNLSTFSYASSMTPKYQQHLIFFSFCVRSILYTCDDVFLSIM